MVDQHGYASIRTLVCEPLLFLNVLRDVDGLVDVVGRSVGFFKLLEDDACFVAWRRSAKFVVKVAALLPFGVPKVSSSKPLFAMSPLGLSAIVSVFCFNGEVPEYALLVRLVVLEVVLLRKWLAVC